MGITNFFTGTFFSHRASRNPPDPNSPRPSNPSQQTAPSPSSRSPNHHTPRRRRNAPKDRDRDRDKPHPKSRDRPTYRRNQTPHPRYPQHPSFSDDHHFDHESDWDRSLSSFDHLQTLHEPHSARPNKRSPWKLRTTARVKSNMESSHRSREPATTTRFRDFTRQSTPLATGHQSPAHPSRHAPFGKPRRPSVDTPHRIPRDPIVDGPPSLSKLFSPHRQQHTSHFAHRQPNSTTTHFIPTNEPQSNRRHYQSHRANNRIKSNLEQFIRRDKDKDKELSFSNLAQEKRTPHPASERRRHSLVVDAQLHTHDFDHEPISLINDRIHPGQKHPGPPDHFRPRRRLPQNTTSPPQTSATIPKNIRTSHKTPVKSTRGTTLPTAKQPKASASRNSKVPPTVITSSTSTTSSASTSSSSSSSPLPKRPVQIQPPMSGHSVAVTGQRSSSSPRQKPTLPPRSGPSPPTRHMLPNQPVQQVMNLSRKSPSPQGRRVIRPLSPSGGSARRPLSPSGTSALKPPSPPRRVPGESASPTALPPRNPARSKGRLIASSSQGLSRTPSPGYVDDDVEEPRAVARRYADAELDTVNSRVSADAVYPARRREAVHPAFARSQSNPAPPTQPAASGAGRTKRTQLNRPPPLRTPTNGEGGFAGHATGISRVPIAAEIVKDRGVEGLRSGSTSTVTTSETNSNIGSRTPSENKPLTPPLDVDDSITEPKAYTRFDIWSTDQAKDGSSGSVGSRLSKRMVEKDSDLYYFEEASQSSSGDVNTLSRKGCGNIVGCIERGHETAEVQEDHFVFGDDGSFHDGGFIISSDGLLEQPERVMRKTSDGLAVEGVPTSSNNLIIVKSLDEFRKSFTFKSKPSEGSSTIGRGAQGRVYLASHEPTGRKIAVKEINVYDEEKRTQLIKELQTLVNHRSRFLVRSFGAFYDGEGAVHVTLEYMDRGDLAEIVRERGMIPEAVICKIAEHCLRGLGFLHDNHILHRDVKTGNILLSRKLCRAKLSDFGLARDLKEGSSVTDTFVGTLAYMSPERLHGSEYTYASDIWGLGISVLECALGKYPFEKPQSYFDYLNAAQSNPSSLVENEVSTDLLDFIRKCTDVDPKARPKARELLMHPFITSRQDGANALRKWLDTIPRKNCEDVDGSELAFSMRAKRAKAKAKYRAKAQEL